MSVLKLDHGLSSLRLLILTELRRCEQVYTSSSCINQTQLEIVVEVSVQNLSFSSYLLICFRWVVVSLINGCDECWLVKLQVVMNVSDSC